MRSQIFRCCHQLGAQALLAGSLMSGVFAAEPTPDDSALAVDGIPIEESGASRPVITRSTSDLRAGLCGTTGSFTRSYDEGGTDSKATYGEYGAWLSYTRSLRADWLRWRWEGYLTGLQATVRSDQAEGTLRSWLGGLGLGYAPEQLSAWDGHLQTELMPFAGLGRAIYHNDFSSTAGAYRYASQVDADGVAIEYGVKANLMWVFASGWEAAAQIGYVEKRASLSGTTTSAVAGTVLTGPFETHDVLRGVRYGLFLGRRF